MKTEKEQTRIREEKARIETEELKRLLAESQAAQAQALAQAHALIQSHTHVPIGPNLSPAPGMSQSQTQAQLRTQAQVHAMAHPMAHSPQNNSTPGRKRHSSQQLQGAAKDIRVMGNTSNRFDILNHPSSYPDEFMDCGPPRPDSRSKQNSTADGTHMTQPTYANRVGGQHKAGSRSVGLGAGGPELEVEGVFNIRNEGALREELEVEFNTLNGEKFYGSITPQEAKHVVFRECLGFADFSNFDGARIGYKGCPVVTFKFKSPINVDELYHLQFFNFNRKTSNRGRSHTDTVGCKIRGLRQPGAIPTVRRPQGQMDDGVRKISVQGCEYRVPKNTLIEYLNNFGEIVSDITEELFDDGGDPFTGADGTNRTGNYNVRIKLAKDVPQLLPILGKRIKIHYPGIQRQCPNCFGPHPKSNCHSKKITWTDYITLFKTKHPEIEHSLCDRKSGALNPNQGNVTKEPSSSPPPGGASSSAETDSWVINHANIDEPNDANDLNDILIASQSQVEVPIATNDTDPGPTKEKFGVPLDQTEHDVAVNGLIKGGLTLAEAQSIINQRRTAFNKAL